MARIEKTDAFEVESLARIYTLANEGYFSEPFIRATFLYLPGTGTVASLDLNGQVPLPANVPVIFDCSTDGQNITNISVGLNNDATGQVVVYWTKYSGLQWQK